MPALSFLKSFWPFFVIAGLVMVVLFYRGDHIKMKSERDAAKVEANSLRQVNETNAATMKSMSAAAEANAKIAASVAADVGKIRGRTEATLADLREAARNDKAVHDWAVEPVPGRVRNAIETPR